MLNIVSNLKTLPADIAAVLLCNCRHGLVQQPHQQLNSNSQHTLWPVQQYSTQIHKPRKSLQSASAGKQPENVDLAAKLRDAAPVQPTHRILKVVLQSQVPLTQSQLYEQARAEFGAAAFPSRRNFKSYLHQVQKLRWVQAKPPLVAAVSSSKTTKSGGKAAVKASDPFVYVSTSVGMRVNLNQPGSPLQQAARAAADDWTRTNLGMYEELVQAGKVPVTADNLALVPRERRTLFAQKLSQ